jgi:hypothetical protein
MEKNLLFSLSLVDSLRMIDAILQVLFIKIAYFSWLLLLLSSTDSIRQAEDYVTGNNKIFDEYN